MFNLLNTGDIFKTGEANFRIEQYALNEANFFLVKLLQRYDKIEPVDPDAPMLKAISLILSPGNGVNIKLHRASS